MKVLWPISIFKLLREDTQSQHKDSRSLIYQLNKLKSLRTLAIS
jgi:hypothetical protein